VSGLERGERIVASHAPAEHAGPGRWEDEPIKAGDEIFPNIKALLLDLHGRLEKLEAATREPEHTTSPVRPGDVVMYNPTSEERDRWGVQGLEAVPMFVLSVRGEERPDGPALSGTLMSPGGAGWIKEIPHVVSGAPIAGHWHQR
jgi:hypothetical protein